MVCSQHRNTNSPVSEGDAWVGNIVTQIFIFLSPLISPPSLATHHRYLYLCKQQSRVEHSHWSGLSRSCSHWSRPLQNWNILLCHKEPPRRIQSHILGALEPKYPHHDLEPDLGSRVLHSGAGQCSAVLLTFSIKTFSLLQKSIWQTQISAFYQWFIPGANRESDSINQVLVKYNFQRK